MRHIHDNCRTGRKPGVAGILPALAVLLLLAGCDLDDTILGVQDPQTATADDILDPENLPAVRAHAIGEFQVGYSGSATGQDNSYILMSGLLTDEYQASGSFPTREEVDQRRVRVDNATAQTTFRLMHRGRAAAERAAGLFELNDPGTRPHAEASVLAGLMHNAFGEMYCSGVPMSDLPIGEPEVFGEPRTTEEIFEGAVDWFTAGASIAAEAGATLEANAAAVGLGRALLNLNRYDEAAAAVADVPTGFVFQVIHSNATTRQWNGIWNFVNSVKRWRIADQAGGNGLPYRTMGTEVDAAGNVIRAGDPRVVWFQDGFGFDQTSVQYSQRKYASNTANVPVATGIEARLIEAEAALAAGNTGAFLQIHNDLRATEGLAPVGQDDLNGPDGAVDLHFQERAFWLWQTGHRLGDLRRLVRQYNRDAESVFPTGSYFKGGTYGTDVNFPVPVDEQNNPNFTACLNRDA
ncbi:MAG: hypothetical protein EA350_04365 [Gemmatimonadales bacterium]|nr:MAG: hypothetical protein EA350_04365 [Gemmatimonadales bacterium]